MTKGQSRWTLFWLAVEVGVALLAAVFVNCREWSLQGVNSFAPEVLTGLLIVLAVDVSFNPVPPIGKDKDLSDQQLGFVTAIVALVAVALPVSLLAADINGDCFVRFSGVLTLLAVFLALVFVFGSAGVRLAKIQRDATGGGGAGRTDNGGNGGENGKDGPDPGNPESADSGDSHLGETASGPDAEMGPEADPEPPPVPSPESGAKKSVKPELQRAPQADLVAETLKNSKKAKKSGKKSSKKPKKKDSKKKK